MNRRLVLAVPVLLLGGTEMQMLSVVRALKGSGYGIEVCCYYEWADDVVRLFEAEGVTVHCLNLRRADGLGSLVKVLRPFFRERRDDIVHVQYLAPALAPIVAARLAGARTIIATSHIAGTFAYNSKHRMMLRLAARLCTCFICVSRGVEEFWFGSSEVWNPPAARVRRRHYTVYNAIDVERIRKGVDEACRSSGDIGERSAEAKRVIGIVGRLAQQKGHAVLLDAMREVARKVPDAVLVVVGDGPERAALESRITNHDLHNHVFLLGARPQDEVFALYGEMDVFAMPSLFEGFGLTAAEAMAAELPVVGTRIEGLSEVVEDGVTGYLVPPGDSGALAARLVELLADGELRRRMGLAGYERVKERFGMERFGEAMRTLYAAHGRSAGA